MAHATDVDAAVTEEYYYHVVCHDCPTELLADGESEAEARVEKHESSTDHNVELAALRAGDQS